MGNSASGMANNFNTRVPYMLQGVGNNYMNQANAAGPGIGQDLISEASRNMFDRMFPTTVATPPQSQARRMGPKSFRVWRKVFIRRLTMANILGKILSGVAQGGLDHMRDKRRRKEEEKDWNLRKSHKRELLDMQDEYHVKRENRRRENRLADDERRYNTSLKREQEYQNKKLTEIQELFPERWENPQFQQEVTAAIKGVKVPRLPANKKIAELAMSGKVDEAMKLAYGSSNVEDQDFFKSVVTAISSRKKLDKLLHPEKYQTARPKKLYGRVWLFS